MLCAILKAWHPMIGVDLHIPWPPGSPNPAPAPAPYSVCAVMGGLVPLTTRFTTTSFTDGLAPAMLRGTDIGMMIPHIGPPSITLPLEMLLSGSKSHFGASKTIVKDQFGATGPVAVAMLGFTNLNLNCGYPLPTPFGQVIAPTTHVTTVTLGDLIAGLYLMAFDFCLQAILNKLGSKVGEWMGEAAGAIARRLGVGALSRVAARQMARALGIRSGIGATQRALQAASRARLAAIIENTKIYGFAPIGVFLGGPLGISVSAARDSDGQQVFPSPVDRGVEHLGIEKKSDAVGEAVDNYFNSPSVAELPPSPPPAATSTPDASVIDAPDGGVPTDAGAPVGGAPGDVPDTAPSASTAPSAPSSPSSDTSGSAAGAPAENTSGGDSGQTPWCPADGSDPDTSGGGQ